MIKFEKGSHWYTSTGEAKHDATLRNARIENLYPSPTSIDKDIFKNDVLEKYKLNELAAAAASTFKQLHETDEDYANRIYEISLEKAKSAANFGRDIHDAIEHFPQMPLNVELHPWLDRFGTWYDANVEEVLHRERVVVDHDLGIAGRCDLICLRKGQILIPDWKTQDVKKDDKGRKVPNFYPSWARQLAFYSVAYAKEANTFPDIPACVSVVIDSNEPCEPFVKEWTRNEIAAAYQTFVCGAWMWFSGQGKRKPYWPQPKGPFSLTPSVPMI